MAERIQHRFPKPEVAGSSPAGGAPDWGRVSTCSQYRVVYFPAHHRAWSTGYVYVHILVAEWKLGRVLTDDEIVHHVDGDKLNNSPSNIEVTASHSAHSKLHGARRAKQTHVVLHCAHCGKELRRPESRTPKAKGYKKAFCDHHCAGKLSGFHKKPKNAIKHGTASAYNYHRCRCAPCRKFKRDEARKRRRKS